MKELKDWLKKNCELGNCENTEVDRDIKTYLHRKAMDGAKSALRSHLERQIRDALKDFYSQDLPEEKFFIS